MISLTTAMLLKEAGLPWAPKLHDFFVIPHPGLEDKQFVISEMTVDVAMLRGLPVVTFDGASEWAMDYIATRDVTWIPTEEQLREELEKRWLSAGGAALELRIDQVGAECRLSGGNRSRVFSARSAGEAYAAGLLHLLAKPPSDSARRIE
jgi:hypothetical protein